ncbi:conserved protein of unknown function [Tenacibaculum sp. 190130A14a]|uniref:Uncharacterized protein n=1 Tax=Tenacibaculum polynesiense TaxID=3137857 RepID=A0ABM9P9W2_9FLAO
MNQVVYRNRKKILIVSVFLLIIGFVMTYLKYGIEPWETIGGFLCGIGISFGIISLSSKKIESNRL